jgi:surfeit locus 1 family protein
MSLRLVLALIFGIAGTAVLARLGLWQMQRLEWKQGILDDITARITAAPVALPAAPDPVADRFLPVQVAGRTGAAEILVQASLKMVGPGFRVIAPFETEDGRRILLDRGFIRLSDRDKDRPPAAMTVTGNVHWPDEQDGFTPDPDPAGGLWFARDIDSMAAALDTEPVLVVAASTDEAPQVVTPLPVGTEGIPNNHLGYAVQWFLLAAVWAAMTVYLLASLRRRTPKE